MLKIAITASISALLLTSCATSFTGQAHTPGGRAGCENKCKEWGLDFAGMISMGEYSDACVCEVPGKGARVPVASVAAGATGVVLQMRAAAERQRAMMAH